MRRTISSVSPTPDNIYIKTTSPKTDIPKFISNQSIINKRASRKSQINDILNDRPQPLLSTIVRSISGNKEAPHMSSKTISRDKEVPRTSSIISSNNDKVRCILKTYDSGDQEAPRTLIKSINEDKEDSHELTEMSFQRVSLQRMPTTPAREESKLKLIDDDKIMLNIRFFFSKEKNWAIRDPQTITKSDFDPEDVKKYGENITWLAKRQFYQPFCYNNKSGKEFPINVDDVQNVYIDALLNITSFQFVIGKSFVLPIFTLGSTELDAEYPKFCNSPENHEYKMVIKDIEDNRLFIADLLLLFHIKSDIGDEKITLICGELLQRAGKDEYRGTKYMLIKFIYRCEKSSPSMDDFILSIVNTYLSKKIFEDCLTKKKDYSKYVDWLTKY